MSPDMRQGTGQGAQPRPRGYALVHPAPRVGLVSGGEHRTGGCNGGRKNPLAKMSEAGG